MRNDGRVISVRSAFASMAGGFLAVSTTAPRGTASASRTQGRRLDGETGTAVRDKVPTLEPIG